MPGVVMGRVGLAFGLAMALGASVAPALAQVPEDACYAVRLSESELARQPDRGVRELYISFRPLQGFEERAKGPWRHLRIVAVMADQGQGARDGVADAVLTQVAECRAPHQSCWAYDNASFLDLAVINAQTIQIRTRDFVVADYGNSMLASNLAETIGQETLYTLSRLNSGPCPVE